MLTGSDSANPQIIRLQAASGGFRGKILTVVFTTPAFHLVLKALLKYEVVIATIAAGFRFYYQSA